MENLLSPQRVAAVLDCKRGHVYKLIRDGELAAVKFGPRMVRIAETELQRYRDSKCQKHGDLEDIGDTHAQSGDKARIESDVRYADTLRRTRRLISAT